MPDDDIIFPTTKKSDDDPPPTDMFYPVRGFLSKNIIDTLRFALAIALGTAILFAFIATIIAISGSGDVVDFLKLIFPWFSTNLLTAFIISFFWTFIYGLVFGLIVGSVYNSFVRASFLDGDSWEELS